MDEYYLSNEFLAHSLTQPSLWVPTGMVPLIQAHAQVPPYRKGIISTW